MPRPYPPQFRRRALELVESGRTVRHVAAALGIARVRAASLASARPDRPGPDDNAVVESLWGRMQTELLNRQRWNTRVELANAIFEHIEGFHNRRRRHSALGWATPLEFEDTTRQQTPDPHH